MGVRAYYSEIDPFCCEWLRNLIKAGLIAPGDVDERDIWDVRPDDLRGYSQIHLCAGIGVWSYALRLAGWDDNRPCWTASFPCQPFSAAGKGAGFADERHLWPAGFHLIRECRPGTLYGEQVASKDALQWVDLVQTDMEAEGYAFWAADLCAAGVAVGFEQGRLGQETLQWIHGAVLACPDPEFARELSDFAEFARREVGLGAPHIRQRIYWVAERLAHFLRGSSLVADTCRDKRGARRSGGADGDGTQQPAGCSDVVIVGDPERAGLARRSRQSRDDGPEQSAAERAGRAVGGVANAHDQQPNEREGAETSTDERPVAGRPEFRPGGRCESCGVGDADSEGRHAGNAGAVSREAEGYQGAPPDQGYGDTAMHSGADDGLGNPGNPECDGRSASGAGPEGLQHAPEPGPLGGFWRDAVWIYCKDDKWRPAQPILEPLAPRTAECLGRICATPDGQAFVHPLTVGAPSRVGRLRGYGNCINAPLAAEFIAAYMQLEGEEP